MPVSPALLPGVAGPLPGLRTEIGYEQFALPTVGQSLGSLAVGGTSISIAASSVGAAAPGDLVLIAFAWAAGGIALSTVTDTSGNTWNVVSTPALVNESGGYGWTIVTTGWASGANTITGTLASGAPGGRIWSAVGIPAVYNPVFDQHNESSTTGNSVSITTTNPLARATEAVFITDIVRANGANSVPAWDWRNSSFTVLNSTTGSGTINSGLTIAEYDNGSGTAPVTGSFHSPGSDAHGTSIIAFSIGAVPRSQQLVAVQDQAAFAPPQRILRSRILQPAVQAAAAASGAGGPTVTPPASLAVHHAVAWQRQQHDGSVTQNRWVGYQWAGLAPVTPLIQPHIQQINESTTQRRHVRGGVIAPNVQAAAAPFSPLPKQTVIGQAEQAAIRRAHHGSTVQNRWPGYQWAGLPPVTPIPKQVVQDAAAIWQARLDHRRGTVIAPPVQQQASAGTGPPPFSGPLPRQTVILARATPRQPRGGHITQPRMIQAPVAPPRPVIVDLCPATLRRARGGHIITGRPLGSPVTPPRRQRPIQTVTTRRPRRGGIVRQGPQLAVFGAVTPASTLITTPLTGYVSVGSHGYVATGDTGQPPAGSTAPVKTGDTGFPTL